MSLVGLILCTSFAATAPLRDVIYTTPSRRRLLTLTSDGSNEIPNPLVCLEEEEAIVFRIYLDINDRASSNYPVYLRDHLFNSNPTFDYGDFEELEYYILNTNVTYNAFLYVFAEAGNYMFVDSQDDAK